MHSESEKRLRILQMWEEPRNLALAGSGWQDGLCTSALVSLCERGDFLEWQMLEFETFLSFIIYTNGLATLHCRSYLTEESSEELQGMYHPYQDSAERDVIFYLPPTKSLLKEILSFILSTKVLVRQDWSDIRLLSRIAISHPAGPISARSPSLRPTWRHRQFELFTFTNVTIMRQVMRSLKSAAWSLASLSGLCWLLTVNGLKQDLFIFFLMVTSLMLQTFFAHSFIYIRYVYSGSKFFTFSSVIHFPPVWAKGARSLSSLFVETL